MSTSSGVSVVIPTAGGRAEILDRTIKVLLADDATVEVIVVIDKAEEDTERTLAGWAGIDSRVNVLTAPSADRMQIGRGQRCRDLGAQEARASVVLSLDDDVEPCPGLVSGHLRHHERAKMAVLGYMPVAIPHDRALGRRGTAVVYAAAYERACVSFADSGAVLTGLWAGNLSLRRDDWVRAVRGRRSGGATYHEDREFGLLLRDQGFVGVFDPSLRATHWFRRTAFESARDARLSGWGHAMLAANHPDIPLFPPASVRRRLLWAVGRSGPGLIASRTFAGLAALAAGFRLARLEETCIRAGWETSFAYGAEEWREQHG